jgi:Tol biopolymer transport system component
LTWFDRSGKTLSTVGASGDYIDVALSRDGTRAAVSQYDSEGTNLDIWTIDLARSVPSRFTFHQADDANPVWSPDGTKIAFSSQRDGLAAIYLKDSSGAQEQRLQKAGENGRATGWSPDGRFLMYTNGEDAPVLWTLADPLDPAKRTAAPYLDGQGQYGVMHGQFAPGTAGAPRWVAYTSTDAKRPPEVFVQSFPAGADQCQISTGGGIQPRWRADGTELFYMTRDGKMMAVDVKTSPRFEAGIPHALFDTHMVNPPVSFFFGYDVSPDGQRFLVNLPVQSGAEVPQPITVVLNWLAGAKK